MNKVISALGLSALFGGMVFFGAVMTPLVFIVLPEPTAGLFIRASFPAYYAFCMVTAALGAVGFMLGRRLVLAGVLLAVLLVTAGLWFVWLPHLEALREAGQIAAFAMGHHISVWVNALQLVMVSGVLVRAAIRP